MMLLRTCLPWMTLMEVTFLPLCLPSSSLGSTIKILPAECREPAQKASSLSSCHRALSSKAICLSWSPSLYFSEGSSYKGRHRERCLVPLSNVFPLSPVWVITAHCLGPHQCRLNGRHTWQRDFCLNGVFLLLSVGLRSHFKAPHSLTQMDSKIVSVLPISRLLLSKSEVLSIPSILPMAQRRPKDLNRECGARQKDK